MASDPSLFIAIRDGYLNVYYSGNSLLKLSLDGERLAGEIHYKYLRCRAAPGVHLLGKRRTVQGRPLHRDTVSAER